MQDLQGNKENDSFTQKRSATDTNISEMLIALVFSSGRDTASLKFTFLPENMLP